MTDASRTTTATVARRMGAPGADVGNSREVYSRQAEQAKQNHLETAASAVRERSERPSKNTGAVNVDLSRTDDLEAGYPIQSPPIQSGAFVVMVVAWSRRTDHLRGCAVQSLLFLLVLRPRFANGLVR